MNINPMKTFSANAQNVERAWYLFDADGMTLGRLSTEIARRLRGKHKPEYTPHVDTGDFIVVINADKLVVTGKKSKQKIYYRHSGYPGGLKEITFEKLMQKSSVEVLEIAVKGMLPKNALGRAMYKKLKVYTGTEHPHTAQQPIKLELNNK